MQVSNGLHAWCSIDYACALCERCANAGQRLVVQLGTGEWGQESASWHIADAAGVSAGSQQ